LGASSSGADLPSAPILPALVSTTCCLLGAGRWSDAESTACEAMPLSSVRSPIKRGFTVIFTPNLALRRTFVARLCCKENETGCDAPPPPSRPCYTFGRRDTMATGAVTEGAIAHAYPLSSGARDCGGASRTAASVRPQCARKIRLARGSVDTTSSLRVRSHPGDRACCLL